MRIGVIGGGQLGRMLALAGTPLGHSFSFLEPADGPSVSCFGEVLAASYEDEAALLRLASGADVVTCEFESVPEASLETVATRGVPVRPGPRAFRIASDRLLEKALFRELGIPTAPFRTIDDQASLEAAVHALGFPAILKTRRLGYD